jgi:hypothetical protein
MKNSDVYQIKKKEKDYYFTDCYICLLVFMHKKRGETRVIVDRAFMFELRLTRPCLVSFSRASTASISGAATASYAKEIPPQIFKK